jgi:MFS family permease
MLTLAATASSAAFHAVIVHVMPYLISVQVPRDVASSIAASMVVSSIAGRLGFGWLGDRMDKRYLLAAALLLEALGLIIFAYTRDLAHAIIFLALFGPGFGGLFTLRLAILGDYFGRKAFGSIQGISQAIHMVGTILSPVFAGWVYDARGSYQWAWLALAMVVFLSIPLALTVKSPKEEGPLSV